MLKKWIYLGEVAVATSLFAAAAVAGTKSQCITVSMPTVVLNADPACEILRSRTALKFLPDEIFLGEDPGVSEDVCFKLDTSGTFEVGPYVLDVTVQGLLGLTQNTYPPSELSNVTSFTAASDLTIVDSVSQRTLGKLVTRDAGTTIIDRQGIPFTTERLSLVNGTRRLKRTTGHVDVVGVEIPIPGVEPASASGTICGRHLADDLFDVGDYESIKNPVDQWQ